MTPQIGYVQGRYEVASFNLPIHLITLLDEFVNNKSENDKKSKPKKSELVSKAICKEIGVSFEEVNAKNAELYPKRMDIAE